MACICAQPGTRPSNPHIPSPPAVTAQIDHILAGLVPCGGHHPVPFLCSISNRLPAPQPRLPRAGTMLQPSPLPPSSALFLTNSQFPNSLTPPVQGWYGAAAITPSSRHRPPSLAEQLSRFQVTAIGCRCTLLSVQCLQVPLGNCGRRGPFVPRLRSSCPASRWTVSLVIACGQIACCDSGPSYSCRHITCCGQCAWLLPLTSPHSTLPAGRLAAFCRQAVHTHRSRAVRLPLGHGPWLSSRSPGQPAGQ